LKNIHKHRTSFSIAGSLVDIDHCVDGQRL
jgi:hypothetical protein